MAKRSRRFSACRVEGERSWEGERWKMSVVPLRTHCGRRANLVCTEARHGKEETKTRDQSSEKDDLEIHVKLDRPGVGRRRGSRSVDGT